MRKPYIKDHIRYFAPGVIFALIGFVVAYQFVSPAPPRTITIATGRPDGNYFTIGRQYSAILARDKVNLIVKETSGSVENLRLIADPDSGVDIIFMQGGAAGSKHYPDLVALGSIYYEPLWVFYRNNLTMRYLKDLRGLRISTGLEGSGTKALAMQLLALNDITDANCKIVHLAADEAEKQLQTGQIDVAFFVRGNLVQTVQNLLREPLVNLLNFKRAEAYTRYFPFLSVLTLPQGVVDFGKNIPPNDVFLIAPTAQLVSRKNLHPALIDLLLQAAGEVGLNGGLFEKPGAFPIPDSTDFPLSSEAKRFYTSGPPFLRRYLPFWMANFLIRMKIMLLPLLAILFPLIKLLPPFYKWRVRSRIFRWYDQILEIDYQMLHDGASDHKDEFMTRLAWIEQQVSHISVPRGYYRELYDMRVHIEMLRAKLNDSSDRHQ